MTFMELAQARYSVRSFSDRTIDPDTLATILEAGRMAPTAGNYQPQRIYVIKSEEALAKLRTLTKFTYGAPAVLMFCSDADTAWKNTQEPGYDSGEMDATIVGTHVMLAAAEAGLGTVWVRAFSAPKVAEAFGLPENIRPAFLMPIGYPSEKSAPHTWHTARKELCETVQEL